MRNFWLSLLFLLPLYSWGQSSNDDKQQTLLGEGRLHVGVTGIGGHGRFLGTTGHIAPQVQYFLKDGWSIAVEGRYDANGGGSKYTGVGLSTRYYFIRANRFAMFGQVGATYGQSEFRKYEFRTNPNIIPDWSLQRANAFQSNAGLGLHYRVSNRWAVQLIAERTLTNTIGLTLNTSPLRIGFGVNFRIK